MNISVIGLGKLGLCTAACLASKGHKVIGVDKNDLLIDSLKQRKSIIEETGLSELLETAWDHLEITKDVARAILNSDITLILVPTPSKPDGKFSNKYVEDVLRSIGPSIKEKQKFHVVNVVSTVMPGSSNKLFKPILEDITGKICGEDFGFVYNPEFIALGSVIHDFFNPDMILIGTTDEKSGDLVKEMYETTVSNHPEIKVMSLINAEITKLSLNCYVTMKISFANELAALCEHTSEADVDIVTNALGADSRVGKKYLIGGLGFAGPCFPRDNLAFQAFAQEANVEARLGKQVVAINEDVVDRLLYIIKENTKIPEKVAILGLSYKPNTHIIEESQSIELARRLVDLGYRVSVHDPKALGEARRVLSDSVQYFEDLYQCAEGAAAAIIMTNWTVYSQIDFNQMEALLKPNSLVLDSWRILKNIKFKKVKYIGLGMGLERVDSFE